MGLRILHSADWHLDSPFASFSEAQREYLRREQRKIPDKIAELCCRHGCDLVLLAGDLFDGPASRESVEAVQRALARCAVPVYIAPGNHDFCSPESPWLTETWPENVHIFTGALESVKVPGHSCRIYGAGYRSMDCAALLEGFRAEGKEKFAIGLVHGDPVVKESPYCPVTAAQVRGSGLAYLALGHIHKAGSFRAGDTLCGWPGCPMGRGWDETGEKGALLVTLGERKELRPLLLDTPRFYDLQADLAEGPESVLPAAGSQDFYRVTLTGFGHPDLTVMAQRLSSYPNLLLRDATRPPVDLWEGAGQDSLPGVFFDLLQQLNETEPRAQLAAEISRALLEGREVKLP